MSKSLLFRSVLTGLGSLGIVCAGPNIAQADCSRPDVPSDDAVVLRMGSSEAIYAHLARYSDGHYKLLEEHGWNDRVMRDEELNTHFWASFLINNGVVSAPPPLRQNTLGEWEYDQDALAVGVKAFHRSWDEYGPLSWDAEVLPHRAVDPETGAPSPSHSSWSGAIPLIPSFTHETGTGVVDFFPEDPGSSARRRSIWDAFKSPDWLLEYNCKIFDHAHGLVAMARTIVHESWHAAWTPGHTEGGSCTMGEGRCDTYIWDAPTSAFEYNTISRLAALGVGSYQIDQRFTCDLVEAPADWIPVQTQMVANEHFHQRAAQSRFVNDEIPGGLLPYTCGLPMATLSVPVDGVSFCPGTTQLRCNVSSDCGPDRAGYFWICGEGCCREEPEPK